VRKTSYVDALGRHWMVALPDGVPDSDAKLGVHLGPPPLDDMALPVETQTRLHNQLFARSIFTFDDAAGHRAELLAAIQAAYAVDGERLIELFAASRNGHHPLKEG